MFGTGRDISNMETDSRRHYSFALNDTLIFSPSLVGTFSFGYTRYFQSISGRGTAGTRRTSTSLPRSSRRS